MTEVTEARLEDIEALFVQTGERLTSDGNGQITLEGVSPSTLYFADRPQREVGHMATGRFIDLWGEGDNSFASLREESAVLAFFNKQFPDAVPLIPDLMHDFYLAGIEHFNFSDGFGFAVTLIGTEFEEALLFFFGIRGLFQLWLAGESEQQKTDQRAAHADRQREGLRLLVGGVAGEMSHLWWRQSIFSTSLIKTVSPRHFVTSGLCGSLFCVDCPGTCLACPFVQAGRVCSVFFKVVLNHLKPE